MSTFAIVFAEPPASALPLFGGPSAVALWCVRANKNAQTVEEPQFCFYSKHLVLFSSLSSRPPKGGTEER